MPIHKVDGGYKWGNHGHVYPTQEGAEKQAAAAHANGWTGDTATPEQAELARKIAEDGGPGSGPRPGGGSVQSPEVQAYLKVRGEYDAIFKEIETKEDQGVTISPALRAKANALREKEKSFTHAIRKEAGHTQDCIALDVASVRTFDDVGRLHVSDAHISKAAINEYYGKEIPGFDELGLDPNKLYRMFRDPEELKKAAPTFNGVQVLIKHVGVTADDHQPDQIVGATGTSATFSDPYLNNELVIWAKEAIDGIEDDSQKELSCGYAYVPVMKAGTYQGGHYDGRMTEIKGNHIALVKKGRAGSDVVIGDEAISTNMEINAMTKTVTMSRTAVRLHGALTAYLAPRLALDAKIDLTPVLAGVTAKNLKTKKAAIWQGAKDAAKDKWAKDDAGNMGGAGPDDVAMRILDMVEKQATAPGEAEMDETPVAATEANGGAATEAATDPAAASAGGGNAKLLEFLKGILQPDQLAAASQLMGQDEETEEEKMAREKAAKDAEAPGMKPQVTKEAMDAALDAHGKATEERVLAKQRSIYAALNDVKPWVGELPLMAHDSAESVHRAALTALGVDAKDLHPDSLMPIIKAQPKPGARKVNDDSHMALDAVASDSLSKRFPGAAAIHLS